MIKAYEVEKREFQSSCFQNSSSVSLCSGGYVTRIVANRPWFIWPGERIFVTKNKLKLILVMVSQEQIGKAIVLLRKEKGLSQESFAYESGIDRRYLSDIENGKRNISLDVLNRISAFFKIPLSSFISKAESL